jgi:hypothetical protein
MPTSPQGARQNYRENAVKPQNLLILMSEEHNARMMGCAGHPLARTPNLDALAARGTRFVDAYTNCPICVPARASFATGRYIHDIEYWDNSIAYDGRVPSWGHWLQAASMRVESIGKLHYRLEEDPTGFDKQHIPMHITGGVGMIQLSIRKQFPDFVPPPRNRSAIAEAATVGESEYTQYDRRVADIATKWLHDAASSQEPWTLFVSFVTPHYPLVAPKEFFDLTRSSRCQIRHSGPVRAISLILGLRTFYWEAHPIRRTSAGRLPPISASSALWTRRSAACSARSMRRACGIPRAFSTPLITEKMRASAASCALCGVVSDQADFRRDP